MKVERPFVRELLNAIFKRWNIGEDLLGKKIQNETVILKRQIYFALLYSNTELEYEAIGELVPGVGFRPLCVQQAVLQHILWMETIDQKKYQQSVRVLCRDLETNLGITPGTISVGQKKLLNVA